MVDNDPPLLRFDQGIYLRNVFTVLPRMETIEAIEALQQRNIDNDQISRL